MTKEVKEQMMELIDSYGAKYRRMHEIERMDDMSIEQIHEEYEYTFTNLWNKGKLYVLPACYDNTYTRHEECKELIWVEFYFIRFQNAKSRLYNDRTGIDTEDADEEESWEERGVRRSIIWPQNVW